MEQEVFKAGVRPGSPGTQAEIRMLLCFILSKLRQSMSFSQLYDALSEQDLVNYFELVNAVDELCGSGHLLREEREGATELFRSTPLGVQAGEEFERSLPLSVREKALYASQMLLDREHRLAELTIEVVPVAGGGFQMRLAIPEDGGELVSFSLYVPNKEQCEVIRRRFLNAPRFIYKGVLALLTGDRDVLDEAFPAPEEQLFQ